MGDHDSRNRRTPEQQAVGIQSLADLAVTTVATRQTPRALRQPPPRPVRRLADPREHRHRRPPRRAATATATPAPAVASRLSRIPTVSAIIPCKNNPGTIRATVTALLSQDYPALEEVICVGDVNDPTWTALAGVHDPRLIIVEQKLTPGRRDPNVKRDKGIRMASGEVIALVDSDIVMDPGWLSIAVTRLQQQGGGLVAGGMRSIHDTFWGRFVDRNALAAKTPRLGRPYRVTAENFGKRGFKPPITANAVFTRDLYEDCPLDPAWSFGYEDYEWFWRLAKDGHKILFTGALTAAHHHRKTFRGLLREYRQSANGCGHYVWAHPDSPLARKRLRQAILLPLLAIAVAVGVGAAVMCGYAMPLAGAAVVLAALAAGRELVRARSIEAVVYPAAGLALGMAFTGSLVTSMVTHQRNTEVYDGPIRRPWFRYALIFLVMLTIGAALRAWQLAARPGWQYDEGVYTGVARNLLMHGQLVEHVPYGQPWSPFLYQPPFYFDTLVRWFALTGPSIYHARILGVACSIATLSLLFALLWRIHGPRAALLASAPIVLDGWLLYIQRVSYIENMLLTLITAGLLLYQFALERGTWQWFTAAGVVLGFAAAFKYTGVSVLATVLLCWLIVRVRHRGHLILLATAVVTIACYLLYMSARYNSPRHDWFTHQTVVQIRRVLGLQSSGGTLTSPFKALHLLAAEYRVFIPSFLVALAAFVISVKRLRACYRERNWQPLQGNALLFSWMAAGIVIFGFSSLRFPQYFALILVPMYAYLWTELWYWDRPHVALAAVAGVAVLAGLGSFWLRVGSYDDNAFAQAQAYAARSVPTRAVVVADESIGDLINQPYCREQDAGACLPAATYAFTWKTYLQSTFDLGDSAFHDLMQGAKPMASFTGFNGTVTVWKLHATPLPGPTVGVDVEAEQSYPLPAVRQNGQRVMSYIATALKAQAAGIVWNFCTPSFRSIQVQSCTLSPAAVQALITAATRHGLSVQLRPLIRVGPRSGWNNPNRSWEGHIYPAEHKAWFASLLAAERPYLELLRGVPNAQFVVGTELRGLTSSPYWPGLVRQAHQICGCDVSIAAFDHKYAQGFVPPVANPGVDWYPHLQIDPGASQAAVTRAWKASLARLPRSLLARTSLDEESIRATVGAYRHPENWSINGPAAPRIQARYFTAACAAARFYGIRSIWFYKIPLNDNPAQPLTFPSYFVRNAGARAIAKCARA